MFFSFAEKRRGSLQSKWYLRQVAFDTRRRYLFVSETVTDPSEIAPPVGFPQPRDNAALRQCQSNETFPADGPARSPPSSPLPLSAVSSGRHGSSDASALSSAVYDSSSAPGSPAPVAMTKVWKRKLKVDLIEIAAQEERIIEDGGDREKDFFEISFYGESRKLEKEEMPEADPLLVPSAGLGDCPERYTSRNLGYVQDPFFLRELHQSLQDLFDTLKITRDTERERQRLQGVPSQEELAAAHSHDTLRMAQDEARLTLSSPRDGKGGSKTHRDTFLSRCKISLRFRNEYEFMRFRFVVQTVLGYDKLCARPFRGLPPYDPRNGVVYALIPMAEWYVFRPIEKAIFYTFLRGDLIGRTTRGELTVFQRGAHLCITHDLVIVLRDSCTVSRWCRMQDIHTFEYNRQSGRPYVAFLTDPGASDIVFVPRAPRYGREAIRHFNPELEALRVLEVMRAAFYASLEVRRAIKIGEAPETAVRGFVERVERESGVALNFDPPVLFLGSESECDLPNERPAAAWRAVQVMYSHVDLNRVSRTAVPLYEGHPNSNVFEPALLKTMERHMEHDRVSRFDIVGMNEAAQQELRRIVAEGRYELTSSSSRADSEGEDGDAEYPYSVPGSRYITTQGE